MGGCVFRLLAGYVYTYRHPVRWASRLLASPSSSAITVCDMESLPFLTEFHGVPLQVAANSCLEICRHSVQSARIFRTRRFAHNMYVSKKNGIASPSIGLGGCRHIGSSFAVLCILANLSNLTWTHSDSANVMVLSVTASTIVRT